jgi:hypothetical protein
MWKQFLDFSKQVISLTQKSRQHEADIKGVQQDLKEMRNEMRALTQMVRDVQWEQKHDRDMAARDRENLILRLENYRFGTSAACRRPAMVTSLSKYAYVSSFIIPEAVGLHLFGHHVY